ncbi:[NiFe]-hydrogenase assembly chaperone HybE [Fuscovulum blasticum]|uniref:[NiFe]-hydrogenase assembly chaperone HybE n=1 Tax=Fuscovulum blasticum TaxID=1075 RepID=UPI000D3E5F49|nr:[NiFe]-hydrogenase assembly chaperone HybE [Fuscovulum blasticum]AWD21083.1 rubredoxin [Fuscovulum blasticum]
MTGAPRTQGFEGSYLGAADRISAQAIMECKICWTPYDPAEGDDTRQVLPGTAFVDLPDDWTCPGCTAPKAQFLVREDPGAPAAAVLDEMAARSRALVADFTEIFNSKMRDVPMVNHALHVQAVEFQPWEGGFLGVLVAPWFMNLVFLPPASRPVLGAGEKEVIAFPSGDYEFLHNSREMTGPYLACSLFSPMGDFTSQLQAVDVARAVMAELFKPENRAETDRAAEIRARREAELAPPPPEPEEESEPSRRRLITGGLGG